MQTLCLRMRKQKMPISLCSFLLLFTPGLLLPGQLLTTCWPSAAAASCPQLFLRQLIRLALLPANPLLHVFVRAAAALRRQHDSCAGAASTIHSVSCRWQLISTKVSAAELYLRNVRTTRPIYTCLWFHCGIIALIL
jgi:hypothetical protein